SFFFQAEDGIRDFHVTGVQTCALPIYVKLRDPALLTMGVGTHLDPEVAVIRALTEVAQSRATQIHGTREDTVRAVFMRRAGYERSEERRVGKECRTRW